ncbi:hypothetical protein FGB62_35g14 [Gracilaria domingensis]|nr:hypothetical protein FGB62_35g14 [Gracilaria domingensis]
MKMVLLFTLAVLFSVGICSLVPSSLAENELNWHEGVHGVNRIESKQEQASLCRPAVIELVVQCACSLRIDDEEVGEDLRQLCKDKLEQSNRTAETACAPFTRGPSGMVDEELVTQLICQVQRVCPSEGGGEMGGVVRMESLEAEVSLRAEISPGAEIIWWYHC